MNNRLKEFQSEQKLRGGYYTPIRYASYIAQWVMEKKPSSILEPSCGDGAFLEALSEHCKNNPLIYFYEIDPVEISKSVAKATTLNLNFNAVQGDFIKSSILNRYQVDAVVGNPPYIRYQFIDQHFHEYAKKCFDLVGYKFSKLTNSWVTFIFASMLCLKPGGRLGVVIPSEILQVGYAESLRNYLYQECSSIKIINPKTGWFTETTQGVVMLLVEKKSEPDDLCELKILRVDDDSFLNFSVDSNFTHCATIEANFKKWNIAQLDINQIHIFSKFLKSKNIKCLKDIASIQCSIVTGANNFFITNQSTLYQYNMLQYAFPAISKGHQCKGLVYNQEVLQANASASEPVYLLNFNNQKLHADAIKYIELGESQNIHKRYKCRIRDTWYNIPIVKPKKSLLTRFGHESLKIIHNEIGAYCTDSYFLVDINNTYTNEQLSLVFLNPLTMLSIELGGRFYGGGILEITPSEANEIAIPSNIKDFPDITEVSQHVSDHGVSSAVCKYGWMILKQTGMSLDEYNIILESWEKLKKLRMRK